jgi:hypothetical protein
VVTSACVTLLLIAGCAGSTGEQPVPAAPQAASAVPVLFWLDIWENAVFRSTGPEFSDDEAIVAPTDNAPDGIAVDVDGGKLYWTNMGSILGMGGGTLQRANLDGTGVERIVEPGITQAPKQMALDLVNQHIYWSDREGAKVWRAALDGTDPEVLISGHANEALVGMALDVPEEAIYFSDRSTRKIFRMGLRLPSGQTAADRTDVEELVSLPDGAMPVDLAIDQEHGHLYWTDRGLGTVNRAGLDISPGETAANRTDVEAVLEGLNQPIGISLDVANDRLYYGDHAGGVGEAALDGTGVREVGRGSVITGVTIAHVPVR